MTVYSHNTQVETLERRQWPGRNAFDVCDTLTRVTQADGSVEYLVYYGACDPCAYTDEAQAYAEFYKARAGRWDSVRFERESRAQGVRYACDGGTAAQARRWTDWDARSSL